MKLKTWTLYQASNMFDINNKALIDKELILLVLRPDIQNPQQILGLGVEMQHSNDLVVELQFKELSDKQILEIFQNNLGIVQATNIKELVMNNMNMSKLPILEQNIINIVNTYNAFVKKEPTEFDPNDELIKGKDLFTELDVNTIDMHQLQTILQSGMYEYTTRIQAIQKIKNNEQEYIEQTLKLSTLQSNLILFFDPMITRMDKIIKDQQKTIEKLNLKKENQ